LSTQRKTQTLLSLNLKRWFHFCKGAQKSKDRLTLTVYRTGWGRGLLATGLRFVPTGCKIELREGGGKPPSKTKRCRKLGIV